MESFVISKFPLCSLWLNYLRKIFIKERYRPDSVKELFQRKVLVWRMDCIRFQSKAHQNGFDSKDLFEFKCKKLYLWEKIGYESI